MGVAGSCSSAPVLTQFLQVRIHIILIVFDNNNNNNNDNNTGNKKTVLIRVLGLMNCIEAYVVPMVMRANKEGTAQGH